MRKEEGEYREKRELASAEQTETADDTPLRECPNAGENRCSRKSFSLVSKKFPTALSFHSELLQTTLISSICALPDLVDTDSFRVMGLVDL